MRFHLFGASILMSSSGSNDDLKSEITRLREAANRLEELLFLREGRRSIAEAAWYVDNLAACRRAGVAWLPDWPHACAKPPFASDDDARLPVTSALLELPEDDQLNRLCSLARTSFNLVFTCVDLVSKDSVHVIARDLRYPPMQDLISAPRELTYCNWVAVKNDVLVIPDLSNDKATADHFICTQFGIKFWAGAPLRTSTGVVIGTLCVMDDKPRLNFTDEQSALLQLFATSAANSLEVSLLRKKKDTFRQHVLYNMSHELRTPIHSIMSDCEVLSASVAPHEKVQAIEEIAHQSTALLSIVNDMLDVLRLEANQLTKQVAAFSLQDIVLQSERAFTQHTLNFRVDNVFKGLSCVGDGHKTQQILNALLSNAIKFGGRDSSPLVEIDFHFDGVVASPSKSHYHRYTPVAASVSAQPSVYVRVIDHGKGIPNNSLHELFHSDHQHGGLGLILCQGLIRLLDGQLMVESLAGDGSVFHVIIPMTLQPIPESPSAPQRSRSSPSPLSTGADRSITRVLVVDDNMVNLKVAERLLRGSQFAVVCVDSAELCLQRMLIKDDPFEVVLMDVQMPIMDGVECTKHIRLMDEPACRAIVIAATASAADVRGLDCFDDVMEKPFSRAQLVNTMTRHLLRRRLRSFAPLHRTLTAEHNTDKTSQ